MWMVFRSFKLGFVGVFANEAEAKAAPA